ncbi:hypothetical protein MZO46_05125 [Bacillus safensis]|nr:hypothetical protein [Bacillus safensis]MCK8452423.1 hypothetical protein [Bacillus safensis]
MNMKKAMLTIPLSAALLFPAAHIASAHEGHMYGEAKKTSSSQEVSNKATDLRAALDQLFSEHAYLAVVTMQKGIDGSKDFNQAAAALNENTNDLSDAIASVYGKKQANNSRTFGQVISATLLTMYKLQRKKTMQVKRKR